MKHKKISKLGATILRETSVMRPIDLANSLCISKSLQNYLIRGDRKLTVRIAKRLASVTNKSAREWLEIAWAEELG